MGLNHMVAGQVAEQVAEHVLPAKVAGKVAESKYIEFREVNCHQLPDIVFRP